MGEFPPMVDAATEFSRVMERDSYGVIFKGMLTHASKCLENGWDGNVIVTGNPGIGKSRFYLYCAFHLVTRQLDIVEKLPSYRLLLNCSDKYHLYDADEKVFVKQTPTEVDQLASEEDVVRLIDGDTDRFYPWEGINILFASPGVTNTKNLEKNNCRTFVMPVWTFDEIEECNELLKMDAKLRHLALPDADLKERYDVFGGVARWVFCDEVEYEYERTKLDEELNSKPAMEMLKYAQIVRSVPESHFSHRVFRMIPYDASTYEEICTMSFVSDYVGEALIERVDEDRLQELSVFATANVDDETSSIANTLRGQIFELLSHKWFLAQDQLALEFRSLDIGDNSDIDTEEVAPQISTAATNVARDSRILTLTTLERMEERRFAKVDEICKVPGKVIYYRPSEERWWAGRTHRGRCRG